MVAAPDRASIEGVKVGSAPLDWADLGFQYRDVNCHVKFTFKRGEGWSAGELVKEPYVRVHIANTALHYGQAVFEGLKAFQGKDGRCVLCVCVCGCVRMLAIAQNCKIICYA